ncbi:hypothetical protein ABTM87_19125, partial [Acinetobacter baumannii]
TLYSGSSNALVIDAGATVSSLNVAGTISASTTGDQNSATAVNDQSGGISTVNLTGHITATVNPTASTIVSTGKTTALNLSQNTSGVTIKM